MMGGKVLEYEAKTILNKGREEGREEGIMALVSTLKEMNVPVQTILEKVQEKYSLTLDVAKKYV